MDHTAVSATQVSSVTHQIWQHEENYCNFASFKWAVDKKTSIIQMGPNNIKLWLENESQPIMIFRFLRILSLISKDQKDNIICTMDDVRGDF